MTLRKKNHKTFAQPSPFENIFQAIKPGQGGQIEVLISWHERILQTCHYPIGPAVTVGNKANINLPLGTMFRNFKLIESRYGQPFINLPIESKNYIQKNNDRARLLEAAYQLNQNEVVFITFSNNINLAIRFSPLTKNLTMGKQLFLTASETTAVISAVIITFFSNLFFSVKSLKIKSEDEPVQRIVEVIFERPKKIVDPVVNQEPLVEIPKQPEPDPIVVKEPLPEVKPVQIKPKNRLKLVAGLNRPIQLAQSVKLEPTKPMDVSKVGLMSILGSAGIKEKIDRVNHGSTETIGVGEIANGAIATNAANSNQNWDEKLKNIGDGGLATATVGLAQQKTNRGRYGNEMSFDAESNSQKDQLKIQAGTGEENFIGTIDRDAVRRAVRSHLPAIKYCFEREFKKNTLLNGKVVVAWEINREGYAQNARVIANQTTIDNHIVEECVRSVIETIRFPEPPQDALVEITGFPFVFSGLK